MSGHNRPDPEPHGGGGRAKPTYPTAPPPPTTTTPDRSLGSQSSCPARSGTADPDPPRYNHEPYKIPTPTPPAYYPPPPSALVTGLFRNSLLWCQCASDRGVRSGPKCLRETVWHRDVGHAPVFGAPQRSVVDGLHLGRGCKAGRVPARPSPVYRWLLSPSDVDPATRTKLAACWLEVSNAGGAVGFPFIPVTLDEVAAATERLVGGLDPHRRGCSRPFEATSCWGG